jgi:hypothetical protein
LTVSTPFPPRRESLFVPFSTNFKTKITASPTTYSLTAPQATAYGTLHDAFITKWDVCQDPNTKTKTAVEQKEEAKRLLLVNLRMLAKIVQNSPTTTNAMRIDLNLPQRAAEPTPVPIPGQAPELKVVSIYGHTIRVSLRDSTHERRGRPRGVAGAQLYSYVGTNPPNETEGWTPQGTVTRSIFDVVFPVTVPAGAKVFFTACWYNPRGMTGPACTPVVSNIGYEGALPLAG